MVCRDGARMQQLARALEFFAYAAGIVVGVVTLTGLGLKEAKDLVDGAPKAVKEKVAKAESADMKKKLEEVGATVEVK